MTQEGHERGARPYVAGRKPQLRARRDTVQLRGVPKASATAGGAKGPPGTPGSCPGAWSERARCDNGSPAANPYGPRAGHGRSSTTTRQWVPPPAAPKI